MNKPQVVNYGSWQSPVTSELIVSKTIGVGAVMVDGENIYWLEKRPQDQGRSVLVRYKDGDIKDLTPSPLSVRSNIHEYGGGAYIAKDTIYFSNYGDKRIYQQVALKQPQALTNKKEQRYADITVDSRRNRLICVCEDHQTDTEAKNSIITVNLSTGKIATLIEGNDFYSSPRLSPDGQQLAWLSWDHPHLPWDSTYLWLADIDENGLLDQVKLVAGGEAESVCEPKWSQDGRLYFVSDRTNWWNIYRREQNGSIDILHQMAAEFAYPHWVFGLSTYDFAGDRLVCAYSQNGSQNLGEINLETKKFSEIRTRYTNISDVRGTASGCVVFVGGSPTEATAVIKLDLNTGQELVLKQSGDLTINLEYLSLPEAIAFPTTNKQTAYAWYYPPTNKDFTAPAQELPPLIVKSHGGPTAAASVDLNLRIQYWTSRGFGYLDVNYGGSIGYGREYRQRLDGKWGIVDVDDCVNAAKYLVDRGKVDGNRLVITGSSAGGYTTLAALTFRNTFKAGASYYGISDLEILANDTHKFESRYLDRLIGKYPETKAVYQERSPIHFCDRLDCPVIFFQGLQDKVVPPNQAEMMFNAIKAKNLPVAYVVFEHEAHGFRISENIKKALDSEFYFYARVFGFQPAEAIEPVEIINLD